MTHRILPNWAAAALLSRNKNISETVHNPKRMAIVGAVIGAAIVTFLNATSSAIPSSLQVTAVDVLVPAATLLISTVMPIVFGWLLWMQGKELVSGNFIWWTCTVNHGECCTRCCVRDSCW